MKYHFKIFAVIHGFYFSAPQISVKPDILDSLLLLKQPWQGILRNLTDFEWSYRKKFNFFYFVFLVSPYQSINFDLSWLTPADQFPTPNLKSYTQYSAIIATLPKRFAQQNSYTYYWKK